jgi:hypothetical protein
MPQEEEKEKDLKVYAVTVTRTEIGVIFVEASSQSEAERIAEFDVDYADHLSPSDDGFDARLASKGEAEEAIGEDILYRSESN